MPSSKLEITPENLSSEPVKLVQFSHGCLKRGDPARLTWNMYKRKRAMSQNLKNPQQKILTATSNGMMYVGKNFDAQAIPSSNVCDYYVGIHHRSYAKIQILPAEIYRMEPHFKGKAEEEEDLTNMLTYRDKRTALAREFGSGKSQRAMVTMEKNKLDEAMVTQTTRTVADSQHTLQQAEEATTPGGTKYVSAIPPHNKDATTPGEVYKLNTIINEDIMPALATQCEVFVQCTHEDVERWRAEKTYMTFILDKLQTLAIREDARLFQSQCLMYLHCLVTTYKLKYTQIRLKHPLPQDWQEPVKTAILDTFTYDVKDTQGKTRRVLPGPQRDLLLSHILVLCLKLSGFVLHLNTLVTDLNIAQKRLSVHLSALGCTLSSKADKDKGLPPTSIAQLKVPLRFPESKGKSNKKRIF